MIEGFFDLVRGDAGLTGFVLSLSGGCAAVAFWGCMSELQSVWRVSCSAALVASLSVFAGVLFAGLASLNEDNAPRVVVPRVSVEEAFELGASCRRTDDLAACQNACDLTFGFNSAFVNEEACRRGALAGPEGEGA